MGALTSVCYLGLGRSIADLRDQALVLRVQEAPEPSDESQGVRLFNHRAEQLLYVRSMQTPQGLEAMAGRARCTSHLFPSSGYRSKAVRRCWLANISTEDGASETCVMQMAAKSEDRSIENVRLDIEDAMLAGTYAHRFNLAQATSADKRTFADNSAPTVKVAIPIACEVVESSYPSMVPEGSVLILSPYPWGEVRKFVFDGTQDFVELPQAYFHYAAFNSNSKHFVCDIQGNEDDDGNIVLVDPFLLRAAQPSVGNLVGAVVPDVGGAAQGKVVAAPTLERFETMHPQCSQLCEVFDPQRKTARRNAGFCAVACGLGG